jgi:ATP-dependent Clp protease protease subunit
LDPDQFVRFFTKHVKDENDKDGYKATGKPYDLIIGYRDDDSSDTQAHRYDKTIWTEAQARKHCKAHDGKLFEPATENKSNRVPFRCFDGTAQPYEPFWRFMNAAESESGQAELELYGVISEYSWCEDDITPKKFKDDLYAIGKGGPVLIKINSPGGDIIAASVMRATMTEYPGEITAQVDGMAASAAVVVTMAAKTVMIMDTAYMMIHDPAVVFFFAVLDIETLGKYHDDLKNIKDGILPVYAAKTGLSEDKLSRMMADETWMSARQAVDFGFADEVIQGGQKSNVSNVAFVNTLRNYANVPPALLEQFAAQAPALRSSTWTDDNEREAQTLRERVNQILEKENSHA